MNSSNLARFTLLLQKTRKKVTTKRKINSRVNIEHAKCVQIFLLHYFDERRKDQKGEWDETINFSNQLKIRCRPEASQQYTAISCFVKSLSYL